MQLSKNQNMTGTVLGGFRQPFYSCGSDLSGVTAEKAKIRFWFSDDCDMHNFADKLSKNTDGDVLYWSIETVEGYAQMVAEIYTHPQEIETEFTQGTCKFTPTDILKDSIIDCRVLLAAFMHPASVDVNALSTDELQAFEPVLSRKSLIAIRRQTAINILQSDDDEDNDYASKSDAELFDDFVGAGYIENEDMLYPTFYEGDCPDDCMDAEVTGNITGWPTGLSTCYKILGKNNKNSSLKK